MKNKIIKTLIILAAITIPLVGLKAANKINNETLYVAPDEVISGNLFAAGENIIIDGVISGDLIIAAKTLLVTGRVEGDILAIAQTININGEVGGNVRVLGDSVNIDSSITRNLNAFGTNIIVEEKTRIGWDVLIVSASSARIRGNIFGSLNTYAQKVFISGKIGKNVDVKNYGQNQNLTIAKETVINGDLNYSAKNVADINSEANISGQINYQKIIEEKKFSFSTWAWNRLFSILSIILIGLIFVFLLPKHLTNLNQIIKLRFTRSLLIGSGLLLIVPPLTLILLFSIVGIPLAISLFALWLAGIFIAKTVAAIILGNTIIIDLFKKETTHIFWSLILGAFLLSLLFVIPFVGWFIRLLAIAIGLGGLILYVTNKSKNL